jgi:hypothetical protein
VSVLAVDIVVIPDAELVASAIALNRALRGVPNAPIVLDSSTCLPHVSLCMACVAEDAIPALANALDILARAHAPIELVPAGFHARHSQTGYVVTSVELARTPALKSLHEAVMGTMASYPGRDAAPEMFVDPRAVPPSTLQWVNEYASGASFDRFWPHITLGMGALPTDARLPAASRASYLALCQLGPHCTCRRVLAETALQTR